MAPEPLALPRLLPYHRLYRRCGLHCCYWLFASGLQFYLRLFLTRLLLYPLFLFVYAFLFVFLLFSLPFWILSYPIEKYLIGKWERDFDPEGLKKLQELKKKKEVFLSVAREKIKFRADWMTHWGTKIYARTLTLLSSRASLGLAPLYSYSYEEDEKAAKAPLQILATAMARLQIKLRHVRALKYIKFRILPPMISVANVQTAHLLRKWLGLDALLWGSYLSTDPPRIWLNIELSLTQEAEPASSAEEKTYRSSDLNPFNTQFDIDPTLVINQDEILDGYTALLVTLFLILQARQSRKFTIYPKFADQLYYSVSDRNAIFTSLVKEVLFSIQPAAGTSNQDPSAIDALIHVAGVWISQQLDGLYRSGYSNDLKLLHEVAERCIVLQPEDAGGYYRLAAILCALEKEKELRAAIKTGIAKDNNLHWIGGAPLSGWAGFAISTLDSGDEKMNVARALVYSWRAVEAGGDWVRKSLRRDLEKTLFHLGREYEKKRDSVGVKLLYELLPPIPVEETPHQP